MGQQAATVGSAQYSEITNTALLLPISSFPVEIAPYSIDILGNVVSPLNKIGDPPLRRTKDSSIILDHLPTIE